MFRTAKTLLFDAVFPVLCVACGMHLPHRTDVLCAACYRSIRVRSSIVCMLCGMRCLVRAGRPYALCHADTPLLGSAAEYGNAAVRALVFAAKYGRSRQAGAVLGGMIAAHVATARLVCTDALVVPVPLHWIRYLRRGHNQAAGIAREFALRTGADYVPDGLLRVRHTRSQTTRSMEARAQNVQDAFVVLDPQRIAGNTVILVDDVATTGATLRAAATPLRRAGAARILCLTAAGG